MSPAAVSSLGVIGAGIMGAGISEVGLLSGAAEKITLVDVDADRLHLAAQAFKKRLSSKVQKGEMSASEQGRLLDSFQTSEEPELLAACDFVIEAVPESIETKSAVLKRLSGLLSVDCIIATNTSAIPIAALADFVKTPERFIGMHFMNPVSQMMGVEIICGAETAGDVGRRSADLAAAMGKKVTFCQDSPGFVINRLLVPALTAAVQALDRGWGSVEAIDRFCKLDPQGPGHHMGPLMLADLIGLDTLLQTLAVLQEGLGPEYAPGRLLKLLVERGDLGRKSGRGFYTWRGGRLPVRNETLPELLATEDQKAEARAGRLYWLVMINQAAKLLEEQVSSPKDIDSGCLYCLGHKRGILSELDRLGAAKLLTEMRKFAAEKMLVGSPAGLLKILVDRGFTGQESGRGIYLWPQGSEDHGGLNPELESCLAEARKV
jgi:3-hydroxybutyryl-CoA dehydrogenase